MTTTTEAMRLAREALADMLAEVDPDSTTARKRGREALAAIDAIPQHDAQPNCHSTRPDVAPPSRPDDYCTDIQCRVMGRCRYAAPAADIDEEQLARLSERGAVAWAGVDAQSLRDGGAELPAIPLYVGTAPAAQAQQPDDVRPHSSRTRKDALRYRWLRERLLSADFDYGGEGVAALVFELPAGSAVSADCDATIDGAMGLTPAETAATASVAGPAEHPSRADLIAALQFYAAGNHRITVDESAWDTVSGEPVQWLANEVGDMVEDGTIAAQVLAGALTAEDLADDDDEPQAVPAQEAAEWVDANVTGNDALMQAMRNHAAQAAPAQEAPSYVQRGWLIEWPGLGGTRSTIWNDSDAAAKAIGCPHEPVYVLRPTTTQEPQQ